MKILTTAVKVLLDNENNINFKTNKGYTALMTAIWGLNEAKSHRNEPPKSHARYYEIIKILLDKGIDIEVTDDEGNTALMYASEYGQKKIVNMLQRKIAA